jgi:hypothetical protein
MVPVLSLWLPIVLSAVLVFLASSVIHMLLGYHRSDYRAVPEEDQVRAALRQVGITPGEYVVPYCATPAEMGSPEFVARMEEGPVAFLTVVPNGPPSMGKPLVLWFIYSVVVSVFAAYIAGRAVAPGGDYLAVFRFAGCTAFVGYALALWQGSIWYGRSVSSTVKSTIDGLVYALLTAGVFGWLWPG